MNNISAFNPRHILCPVDFSDLSILALKYAVTGAKTYGSRLTLLHSEMFEMPRYFSQTETDRLQEELFSEKKMATKKLADYVMKDLGKRTEGLDIQYRVTDATAVEAILEASENSEVDLIVIGTHGIGGFKRLLLGSTAESVIHNARVPIFTVRQKQHEFIDVTDINASPRIERILCASDLKEHDRKMLKSAVSLAEHFKAGLTVLYIDDDREEQDLSKAKTALCDWVSGTTKTQCEFEPVIRKGEAADQIITHAKETKSDLIVIGARHKVFHDSTIIGKTTDLVVRHARAPVLVIPSMQE